MADGRHVNLTVPAPVQFHEVRPRDKPIVAAEAEAPALFLRGIASLSIQIRPPANPRTRAIRADDPASAHQFSGNQSAFRMTARNGRLPQHVNAARRRMFQQNAMQMRASDAVRFSARKFRLGLCAAIQETNTAESKRFAPRNGDAELSQ